MVDAPKVCGVKADLPRAERDRLGLGLVLLVGECPTRSEEHFEALSYNSGKRIADLARMGAAEYLSTFDRANLLPFTMHRRGWPRAGARDAALALLPLMEGRRVVFLGANVRKAFAWTGAWLEVGPLFGPDDRAQAVAIPHPSGKNLWYNDRLNRESVSRVLCRLVREARRELVGR